MVRSGAPADRGFGVVNTTAKLDRRSNDDPARVEWSRLEAQAGRTCRM
jgi:hypothetical protein